MLSRLLVALLVASSAAFQVQPVPASRKQVARSSEPAMPIWDFGTANFERPEYQHNKGIFGFSLKNDAGDYGRPKEAIYYDPDAKADFGVILSALAMPAIGLAFCAAVINA